MLVIYAEKFMGQIKTMLNSFAAITLRLRKEMCMNKEIVKMQGLIKQLGFKQIVFENDDFLNLLFYDTSKEKSMIFGLSYDKNNNDKYFDVGNIAIEPDNRPHLGCFTIIREVNKENVKEAIKIVTESAAFGNDMFINYHDNIDTVISEYVSYNKFNRYS